VQNQKKKNKKMNFTNLLLSAVVLLFCWNLILAQQNPSTTTASTISSTSTIDRLCEQSMATLRSLSTSCRNATYCTPLRTYVDSFPRFGFHFAEFNLFNLY